MNRPEVGTEQPGGYSIPPQTIINGEISILTSRDLIGKVIHTIGAENLYPAMYMRPPGAGTPEQLAIKPFEDSLSVTNVPGSSLIQVTFAHPDPYMAPKVVNTLVDAFKDKHLEVFSAKQY